MEKKITKRDMFVQLKTNYDLTADEIAFIDHEIELLNKRSGAERKPSSKQIEFKAFATQVLAEMEAGKPYVVADLIDSIPSCVALTPQKVASVMASLFNDGAIQKEVIKRKTYYTKIAD